MVTKKAAGTLCAYNTLSFIFVCWLWGRGVVLDDDRFIRIPPKYDYIITHTAKI